MRDLNDVIVKIKNNRREITTKDLYGMGLNQYYINKLISDEVLERIDKGIYKYNSKARSNELYEYAKNLKFKKAFDQARIYFRQAINEYNGNDKAYLSLIIDCLFNKDYKSSLKYLQDYLDNKEELELDELDKLICVLFNKDIIVPEYIFSQAKDGLHIKLSNKYEKFFDKKGARSLYFAVDEANENNYYEAQFYLNTISNYNCKNEKVELQLNILKILISNITYKDKIKKDKLFESEENFNSLNVNVLFNQFYTSYNKGNFKSSVNAINNIINLNKKNGKFNPVLEAYIIVLKAIMNMQNGIDPQVKTGFKAPNYDFSKIDLCLLSIKNKDFQNGKSFIVDIINEQKENGNFSFIKSYNMLNDLLELFFKHKRFMDGTKIKTPEIDVVKFSEKIKNNAFDEAYELVKGADNKGLFKILFRKLNEELSDKNKDNQIVYIDEVKYSEEIEQINNFILDENFDALSIFIASISYNERVRLQLEGYALEKLYQLKYYKEAEPYYKDLDSSNRCSNMLGSILTLKENNFGEKNN